MDADGVALVRRALGPVGAFLGVSALPAPVHEQLAAARGVQGAGYRALWTNEVIGADALLRTSLWLAATENLVVGTCIANMWARPAQTAHAAATQLAQAHPGRFVLGLGVGYRHQAASVGREFGSPVAIARAYTQQLSEAVYPRILAANGPRMLAVAGELSDGALPAAASPAATDHARGALGPDKLLVLYFGVRPGDSAAAVRDAVRAHLHAGADHVIVGMSYDTPLPAALDTLHRLAPTLTTP